MEKVRRVLDANHLSILCLMEKVKKSSDICPLISLGLKNNFKKNAFVNFVSQIIQFLPTAPFFRIPIYETWSDDVRERLVWILLYETILFLSN